MRSRFFLLCWWFTSVIYFKYISHFGLSVLFLADEKVTRFWCALRFFNIRKNGSMIEKMDQTKFNLRISEKLTVAFGESTVSRTQIPLSYNRFKEGRADVNDYSCPVRPSTSTTDETLKQCRK